MKNIFLAALLFVSSMARADYIHLGVTHTPKDLVQGTLGGSVIYGIDGSEIRNATINKAGNFTDWPLDISRGLVTGKDIVLKFGNAPDIDTADGEVPVWGGTGVGIKTDYTFSTTADIDSISSSNAGDTQVWTIEGPDTNWAQVTQNVTLSGQTRVALGTSLIRVNRAFNTGSTDNAGNVYIYVNGAITAGVPDDNADVRAVINTGNNQTQIAGYAVPANKTAYLTRFWTSINKQANVSSVTTLKVRNFGSVFRVRNQRAIHSQGNTGYSVTFTAPLAIDEKSDIWIFADASANNTGVSGGFDIILVDD